MDKISGGVEIPRSNVKGSDKMTVEICARFFRSRQRSAQFWSEARRSERRTLLHRRRSRRYRWLLSRFLPLSVHHQAHLKLVSKGVCSHWRTSLDLAAGGCGGIGQAGIGFGHRRRPRRFHRDISKSILNRRIWVEYGQRRGHPRCQESRVDWGTIKRHRRPLHHGRKAAIGVRDWLQSTQK